MPIKTEPRNSFQTEVLSTLLANVDKFATRNAFFINDVAYTYKQLGEAISKVRYAIQKFPPENIHIGLAAHDDFETYASIIALWLEGKAYVPLHPNQPLERCEEIARQINITTILDSNVISRFEKHEIVCTSTLSSSVPLLSNDVNMNDEMIAYVLFTSGSTGTPKGVMISQQNVQSFMDSFWASGISLNEDDRCLQCFDLTFDVSVQCYLAPLMRGACVFTIPHDQIKYSYAYGLMEDHKLTFGAMAPSMIRYLKPYFHEINLPSLKYCILTGEASPVELAREWQKCVPEADLYNFYGPTETTIYCTYYKIGRHEEIKGLYGMLSIGKPMKNVTAVVVDESTNLLNTGEKGELCISGPQVSPGYWNSPDKNAQSFFEKEWRGELHRFYHTGDLCYIEPGSTIMLYGRLDSQAKIQGYRVELGEIEFHAREHLNGNNAVVITFTNSIGNTELAMFIEGKDIDTPVLMNYMRHQLPGYMIPTKLFVEDNFPLNSNGKVDKKKLKEKIA